MTSKVSDRPDIRSSIENEFLLTGRDRSEWIESQSIHACMLAQKNTYPLTMGVIPMICIMVYSYVYLPGLFVWALSMAILTGYRYRVSQQYLRSVKKNGIAEACKRLQMKTNYLWSWPATGALWGSLSWIVFGHAPLFNQFVCWLTLACICLFGVTSYSAHKRTVIRFISANLISILIGLVWRYAVSPEDAKDSMMLYILPLHLVFWGMLVQIGSKLNVTHVERFMLMDTIEYQKQVAFDAIEAKNRFFASAAHDIRQPVLALNLYANLLKSDPRALPHLSLKIETITRSVIEMFDTLFEMSRIDSGKLVINRESLAVTSLLEDIEVQYAPMAQAKNLRFRVALGACDYMINSDYQALKRILGNLVMNAIKFTHEGGVLLTCRQTQAGVKFEVWDTGVGIAPEQQTAVFKEFYKLESSAEKNDGQGLGLSIVSKMCDALGVFVSVKSQVGRGSVFRVVVPKFADEPANVAV
jgi:signal transduction histidine kinase